MKGEGTCHQRTPTPIRRAKCDRIPVMCCTVDAASRGRTHVTADTRYRDSATQSNYRLKSYTRAFKRSLSQSTLNRWKAIISTPSLCVVSTTTKAETRAKSYAESAIVLLSAKAASLKMLPAGTVLLSSRAPIGYMAIARNPVTTNQGFKSFVPTERYPTEYIFYAIKRLMPAILQNANGSTFKEISGGTLGLVKTTLPDEKVVKAFCEKVRPMLEMQNTLEAQNRELAKLRDWLLPMLMNGQVSVGD